MQLQSVRQSNSQITTVVLSLVPVSACSTHVVFLILSHVGVLDGYGASADIEIVLQPVQT